MPADRLRLIDLGLLKSTIHCNTDATEMEAAHIIATVLLKQKQKHSGECRTDRYSRDVCDGMYEEKCDDVIGLCEALRAVLALAGESAEIRKVVEDAITEHGGPDVG